MLQRAVALLLQRLLGKFVSFDSSMLRLSLWQGDLSFQDLELRLSYGEGSIGHLSVKIPWRALWTQAVVIKAHNIRIFLHQTPKSAASVLDGLVSAMDDDSSVGNTSIDAADGSDIGDDRTYLSRLVAHIIANVQIELSDVQVRYDCTSTSLAERRGSATLEVGFISLINTDRNWELEFTPQSTAGMESRKLLRIERVAAYIEFDAPGTAVRDGADAPLPATSRAYLFHDWYSTVKASLFYHSANASFPDVELAMDVGCSPSTVSDACSVCRACARRLDELAVAQPRIHFGAEHIDVLYAILIEVKAPYEEYERLTALTQQQASRPEGFLMVLAYAKQWLLADCLDGVAGETYTLAGDSDDDDDDEFEDAITPPSLSVSAALRQGVSLVFFSRDKEGDRAVGPSRLWAWTLGHAWASVKQSCVEDELQLMVESLKMLEQCEGGQQYWIIDHTPAPEAPDAPFLFFKCIVPAYQSRLVGHQPVMDLQLRQKTVVALKDETLVLWMTLLAPVYLWWTQWNLSHPSKLVVHDEARIAPISNMSVDFAHVQVLLSVHERFCFGAELVKLRGETALSEDETHIVSHFSSSVFRFFSATQDLETLQCTKTLAPSSALHDIVVVLNGSLVKASHSRTSWTVDAYACTHGASTEATSTATTATQCEKSAMYTYELALPAVSIDWRVDEIEMVSWVVGKWVFFLPDASLDRADKNLHLRSGRVPTRSLCNARWSIAVPELTLRVTEARAESQQQGAFELFVHDLQYETRRCSTSSAQRLTLSAATLSEGGQTLLSVDGNSRLATPAASLSTRVQRFYADDASHGGAAVLYFVGEVSETNVMLERMNVQLYLPVLATALQWMGGCYDRYHLGFVLSTSYGYAMEQFRANLATLKSHASIVRVKTSASYHDETVVNVLLPQGCTISIFHDSVGLKTSADERQERAVEVGAIECASLSVQAKVPSGSSQRMPDVKGTVRNLQVRDLAIPARPPTETSVMPNRQFIGSNQSGVGGDSVDTGPFGAKNVVDFVVTTGDEGELGYAAESHGSVAAHQTVVRVRLDSVCLVYLHRVYKQFHHFVMDHILTMVTDPFDRTPSSEKALGIFAAYAVDVSELPTSLDETLRVYADAFANEDSRGDGATHAGLLQRVYYEVVANDLTFVLPRSSFSTDSIVLHCTNARFWSAGVDSANSDFLQNGTFSDVSRLSHSSAISDANMAKAQQTRRTELRNVKRLVKNQRSRLLSNRSQLYIDLRNATQQAQNYLHEGFEAFPEAEEAVKIIHHKIVVLDQQLEQLGGFLKEVDDAIDVAKAEGEALSSGGRDSMVFMSAAAGLRGRTTSMAQSEAMDRICVAVNSMSQSLMTPLFVADNAEFHDARTTSDVLAAATSSPSSEAAAVDMSTSSMGLFEFELVDLSGTTSNASQPLFHHALLTGRIERELESLSEATLSSYLGINLSVNELSVSANPAQYTTLLGAIYENFKEVSSIVDEDTYPLCDACNGHHYVDEFCHAIWLRIPIKVADAALRISSDAHPIADIFWEQLELVFVLRTDDSLELNASALSLNAIDVRPTRCVTASEILRPLPGDGAQIVYNQKANWTDSVYRLKLHNTNCLLIYPVIQEVVEFFVTPIFADAEFFGFDVGFMGPAPPEWKKIDFFIDSDGCLLSLLEEFGKPDSRALVVLTDIALAYSTCQNCDDVVDMRKCHFALDQRGVYFSQLPDLQIDASFPLSNAFQLVVDHFVEGTKALHRRNSFVLAPVETRFSVQDGYLFLNIVNNYLQWISSPTATVTAPPPAAKSTSDDSESEQLHEKPPVLVPVSQRSTSTAAVAAPRVYAVDKLLGDVGEVRLVLVNNSLGIPIADFQMREIVCEYVQDEECSTVVGGILSFNYFNNSIYRWEPLVEPFVVQVRVHRALEENSRVEVFANLPNTVNLNLTPAMAPLLSTEALKQADFVTTGSKSTAPFWIQNNTGMAIKFSFRRGKGNIIQQVVPNDGKVSVDCRERGDMRSFDSTSADRFLRDADRNALTVNHTLSVWLNGNKWVSANPVVVDMVGHVSVPLRDAVGLHGRAESLDGDSEADEELLSPPILVAEISIQPDGSKLINLHSQVVLQNRTSVPLMVWAFSPRDGGCVQEWVIDREQLCHVPLRLMHPQSKISIRPSPYVQYAPLATSLEELGDEARVVKSINTKRFIRSGNCVCNFETFATPEELQTATSYMTRAGNSLDAAPLSGYVVRDLPTWKCTYDVEAYYLMRATFSAIDEPKASGTGDTGDALAGVEEEEENEKVEDEFRNVFADKSARRPMHHHPLSDVNYELDEARTNNQRRGLYEATNSSLFYLSVSPFVTLHNRLATAVAYRLLNGSLQLIAEGILAVGNILPLFQVDATSLLYISFRLENYNWSTPKVVINPKSSAYTVPYKDVIEPVELQGRVFDRDVAWEQGNVPNLQLQVKLTGRDVIIFCSVWIVNHSDLDLEYCNSTSTSAKRLESVLKYVHRQHTSDAEQNAIFSTRNLSFHDAGTRDRAMTRLQKVKAASNPVALIVVIKEAKDLYNAQYFGAQSPYVRASLYVLKNPQDRYLDRPEMQAVCTATTKPSPSGGLNPKWDARLQNTLLLRFPDDVKSLEMARVIVEVRNVRYGMDTCLGVTAVKLDSITKDRKSAASFNWYKLLKRKSGKKGKGKKAAQTSVHRGDVCLSFSVGSSQEVRSELDGSDIVYEIDDEDHTPSVQGDERLSLTSPHDSEMNDVTDEDAAMIETQTPGAFPSSAMFRSMHRLQTPASESASFLPASALMMGSGASDVITTGAPPGSIRARQAFPLSDLDSTRAQQDMVAFDPLSTRSVSGKGLSNQLNTSPRSVQMQLHQSVRPLQIYLPQNRFAFVVIEVHASMSMAEIFELVCAKCGFDGVLDINDFDFYELALPRFVSLRSAGRPEGDRWYGHRIPMDSRVEKHGRQHGLHLCHKMTMTTIRLYDETSTASTHHMTPRSLLSSSKKTNPAQNRPMAWGDVLPYSAGGKNWDVLRVKSQSSPWSEVIRLNRNAMGNSGVAQVLSLTNEVYDQDQTSDLRRGNQEIALWSCYGTGRFSDTIIATIVPRYILINRTGQTVKYRQLNVPHTLRLGANEIIPFHWPSASKDKLMEVTLLHGFTWSGSFRIHSIGTTYLKLRDSNDLSRIYILQCQVEMVGGSIALIFREESKRFPPYRIDNMTSFRIQYKQTSWGTARDFDELQPRTSCAYSWDQLTGGEKASSSSSASYQDPTFAGTSTSFARSLQVRFMRVTSSTSVEGDSEKDAVETREYNLDEMTSHRRIQLQRSLPSQLFIKPEHKGYLLKKDNLLKWNKKYFRLYEHMLYYFASESDQELLGVVDLRSGSDVPGAGSVAIFEKTVEAQSKGGFMSLNGLVSSISGTIFGSSSRQLAGDDDDEDANDDDERARDLVQLAVAMTASTELCAESEAFVERVAANGDMAKLALTRKGFYVNGEALVAFLVSDASRLSASQAFATAQEMLLLGVLKVVQAQNGVSETKRSASASSFRSAKSVWYSVNSISLADDTDSVESEDDTSQNVVKTPSATAKKTKTKATKAPGSAQFSIITATKCYDLKAKTPRIAKAWVKRLRMAARESHHHALGDDEADEAPTSMINSGPKTARASRDVVPVVQNAKTYVHVRIRADGPTKVLELFEGGEEDFDEKESKHELSSAASAASESPTASEASTNAFDALTNGISINLRVDSLGISCVNELPMELVYIYFAGVNVHYTRVNAKMRLNMTLDDVQIDNQSQEATFSKLLCPRMHGSASAAAERKRTLSDAPDDDDDMAGMVGDRVAQLDGDDNASSSGGLVLNDHMFSCADCKYRQLNVATMHFCCTWSNEQGTTDYFEHCSFWLHPVISQLDEELLVSARAFLTAMMQSLSQNKSQSRGGEIRAKSIPIEIMAESLVEYKENTMSDDLNPLKSLHASTTTSSTEVRKVYFALLHIHPIEFDITYRSDVFQARIPSLLTRDTASFKSSHSSTSFLREEYSRTASAPASSGGLPRFDYERQTMSTVSSDDAQKSGVAWAIPSLTMHVPDLDNAPVRLNALMIEHAFGTSGDLTRRVTKYYTRQLWKQLHKILGSFDFLGNPVGFLDHIGTGVRDFVYEPIEGLKVGGKGFSKGLAKGTASLVSNTLDGTFDAASKISGTFGQGLATMSLDDHYQQIRARARRHHVRGIREGLIQGSKELSLGVYEGVAGLVLGPMRGAQENGALGFVKGTITGIIGLPVKPVAGIFDFASRATQGVRNRSLQNGHSMRRVRRPRVFGRYNELKCYKEADTIAYDLLKKTGGAKLSGEKIIFYNEILQSVYASELTKQAREKRRMDSTRERTRSFRRSLNEHSEALVDGRKVGSERKLVYEVTFYQKKLGLDLETDFYCENVIVKAFDESCWHHTKVHTSLRPDQKVLQEGDCLITVGGVDVRGIGFEETLALLRGTARPIKLQFESCDEQVYEINASSSSAHDQQPSLDGQVARTRTGSTATVADDDTGARLKVQLTHWLIVTEQRAVYINVSSFANPVVEWMTPLRYIYRIEWLRGSRICLHMSVGVDSLPTGPRSRPTLRTLDSHERDMNVFLDVMWHSFGSATAEEQELWPSDTSLNGFLMKKGGFSTVRRWFVLSRNCLYYFSSQKELRGIIPLGNVRLEADASASLSIRITNATRLQPLVSLQLDNGQVVERVQSEIVLLAATRQDFEMWQSSLAHAAGKGLRHSRGTRFFVPTAASRLEVGCRDTPDFVVAPLAEALKKTVEMFNTK